MKLASGPGPGVQLFIGAPDSLSHPILYIAELTIIVPVTFEHSKRLLVKNGPVSAHCLVNCGRRCS